MSIIEAEPVVNFLAAMLEVPLTAAIVVPQLNPNLPTQEEHNTTTKGRRTHNDKTPDNKLAASSSWVLSNANEDVLLEIFARLPNCRSAIQCSSVCRGWLRIISGPQFIPRFNRNVRRRRGDDCYTILFRRRYYYSCKPKKYYQVVCKLFSKESFLLHGEPPSSSNYLDLIMPNQLMVIRASCNDLLLVSPDPRGSCPTTPIPKLYICNPVTKKWSLIPGVTPHGAWTGFALICDHDQDQHKNIVIIYGPKFPENPAEGVPVGNYNYRTRVVVFSTKSGQWSETNLWFPMRDTEDYSFALDVVACNGILYWMDGYQNLDRIVGLDLFGDQRGGGGVLIDLPETIHNDDAANVTVRLAAVKGGEEMRLLHLFRAGGEDRKCFVAKVWELNRRDNSWVLVHERNLRVPNADDNNNVVSAVFHPKDCDVIFVICGMVVFEYRVLEGTCDKVGEIREPIGIECLDSFVLEHPAWPTVVPSF